MTLFKVSRLLGLWQAQGIVSVRREVVLVHDVLALTKLPGEELGGDNPSSLVPTSLKPKPSRKSGAVALPEPEEGDAVTSFSYMVSGTLRKDAAGQS